MRQEILQLGHPVLRQKALLIEDIFNINTKRVIEDLNDTLTNFRAEKGFGRAIAAPQIGILQRMIFVRMSPTGFCSAIINPEILHFSDEKMELWDDCFSFPDLMVRVKRAAQIEVKYWDEHGNEQRLTAHGDLSELLQHEMDHLDGILAIDRAISSDAFCLRANLIR